MEKIKIFDHILFYRDLGKGTPIVFVHGTPSSSQEFLAVMETLKSQYRCIAPDHLGFGFSDKPENWDYSISNHQKNFSAFINQLDIDKFHLVVHDFGGVIALKYALENPDRILSITIMNSWCWPFASVENITPIQKKVMASWLMKFLYLKLNFSAKALVKMGWGTHSALTKEKHKIYMKKFKNSQDRLGTWSFAQALLDEKDPAWKIEENLHQLSKLPIFILWGESDTLVTLKSFEHWKKMIPNAKSKILKNVGHFVADEAPDIVAQELRNFISRI